MKKKLAIISSYHEACGIANYTERLEPVFRFYYDVTVLPLNTEILRSPEKGLITLGNKLIDEIADKVKEFDYVNIQFEVSLFGPSFNIVFNRVNKIIQNSRNLIFTFHSVNFSYTERRLITRHFLKTLKNQISSRRPYLFYDKLVKSIKTLDCKPDKKANIVVHDDKTKRYIERIYDFPHIYSHPLGYSNEKERQKTYTKDEAKSFRDEYFIEDNEKTIGLFGFVSEYISRIFKKYVGLSPSRYLTKIRMEKACQLIKNHPEIQVKEVADQVGYKDIHYFSKVFRKEMGVWPSEYK